MMGEPPRLGAGRGWAPDSEDTSGHSCSSPSPDHPAQAMETLETDLLAQRAGATGSGEEEAARVLAPSGPPGQRPSASGDTEGVDSVPDTRPLRRCRFLGFRSWDAAASLAPASRSTWQHPRTGPGPAGRRPHSGGTLLHSLCCCRKQDSLSVPFPLRGLFFCEIATDFYTLTLHVANLLNAC